MSRKCTFTFCVVDFSDYINANATMVQGLKYAAKIRTHTTNNSNIIVDIQDQGGHFTHTHSLNHAINEVSFSLQSLKRQIEKDFSVTSKEIEK